MVKPETYFFTNPLPISSRRVRLLYTKRIHIFFFMNFITIYLVFSYTQNVNSKIFAMFFFPLGSFLCFKVVIWLKAWLWPLRLRNNLVSTIFVDAKQFRLQKRNGVVLTFAFKDCTPSILVFMERKKSCYCLKVDYLRRKPDYFFLGNVRKEAENLRHALGLSSFVKLASMESFLKSQARQYKNFGHSEKADRPAFMEALFAIFNPKKNYEAPDFEAETILFTLPWVEEAAMRINQILKIFSLFFVAVFLSTLVVMFLFVVPAWPGFMIIVCSLSMAIAFNTKPIYISAFHVTLSGLYVAYDNGSLLLHPHSYCFFQKYHDVENDSAPRLLLVVSSADDEVLFEKIFNGKEKELDELLHALAIGAEKSG